jgi:hypothetical protein
MSDLARSVRLEWTRDMRQSIMACESLPFILCSIVHSGLSYRLNERISIRSSGGRERNVAIEVETISVL